MGEFVSFGQGRIERSGRGTHNFANGMEYSGNWQKDKMCGNGKQYNIANNNYNVAMYSWD